MAATMVVTVPHLSFATDLLFNLDEVRAGCTRGLTTQVHLVALLKSRIALERQYANELSRFTQQTPLEELEHGTMREALGKLKAQYLNTSVQHRILANNLEEDVLRPIEALYTYNCSKANNLTKLTNNIKKQAKAHEDCYKREYQGFDKHFRDAMSQFAAAMDAGFSSTEIERQYHEQLLQLDNSSLDESDQMQMQMDMFLGGSGSPTTEAAGGAGRPRQKSSAAIQSINNNSQKLVNWLLSSEQQRKENLYTKAVQVLETAEVSRRKCLQSWETVEQSRLDMYRALQSVLTEYQQMAEHRISNLATNLRKHVVFESSALANEQYDWQMIASKIENVDFEGDIREFIMDHFSHDLETMTVNDLCHAAATSSLVFSPNSKPCRPLKKTPLEISDLAMRKIPYDYHGNQAPLPRMLVTRLATPHARSPPREANSSNTSSSRAQLPTAAGGRGAGGGNPRQLSIQIPTMPTTARGTPTAMLGEMAVMQPSRVCLAQDVARAIARAYELRSVEKNSLQSPLGYTSPQQQQTNESNCFGGGDGGVVAEPQEDNDSDRQQSHHEVCDSESGGEQAPVVVGVEAMEPSMPVDSTSMSTAQDHNVEVAAHEPSEFADGDDDESSSSPQTNECDQEDLTSGQKAKCHHDVPDMDATDEDHVSFPQITME